MMNLEAAPRPQTPATETLTRTTLGILSGGEKIVVELVGRELWLTIGGVQIARRGHRGSKQVRDWRPVHRGWRVRDTDDPKAIRIMHNGLEVEWTSRLKPNHDI
jgi:hypothetical protein